MRDELDGQTIERHTGLVNHLKTVLGSEGFKERHRQKETAFTRQRCLTFCVVVLFLVNMVKRALQDELDELFKSLQGGVVAERVVSKSAFTQARQKLKHSAFVELNREQVNYYYQHYEPLRWQGFRLLAFDGSMVTLPDKQAVGEHFGVWHPAAGGTCAKARVSQMFDVLNLVTVEALIAPKRQGERALAEQHCQHLQPTDLLLFDRGYPAFWLFALVLSHGAHFCARMSLSEWKVVADFVATSQTETIIELVAPYQARRACQTRQLPTDSIRLRLIRLDLDNGEGVVLATSLLDTGGFPYTLFKELYHQRWPVEEDYKQIKSRLEVENWTGLSVEAVYQDFHATIFTKNFAAILAQPVQQTVQQQTADYKHRYRINLSNLLSKLKDTIVHLLFTDQIHTLLLALERQMRATLEPIRPGRSFARRKRVKPRRFSVSYKPLR